MSENEKNDMVRELTDDALADVAGGLPPRQTPRFSSEENRSRPSPRRLPEDQQIKRQKV